MALGRDTEFDLIVVGGGHAGVEAALAASRMGRKSAIITMDPAKLALMSCNPAIGGLGKSQLVKEIDALGGIMGEAIDATGIQFRRLNLSRGPAVWSTRAQADRVDYNQYVVDWVGRDDHVTVIAGLAVEILTENGAAAGIVTQSGTNILARVVVICTGTFLGAQIHIGEKQIESGRLGEPAAVQLSQSFLSLGFETGRLKTGTPPRLEGGSVDWSKCEPQHGDLPIPFFSRRSQRSEFDQTDCHLTYTTDRTRTLVVENSHRSAMYSGRISSVGPRYCPSIEDKFFRFADKPRHQIFLEPEGNGTKDVYPNGFSTSLPEDVQRDAIRTVTGLEEAVISKPGYAVEYDYCPAYQIKRSMETHRVPGLFLAGQINGTSGYEEAAAQGLLAGINGCLYLSGEPAFTPDRSQAYIGVMIDDLATRSTTEPYRMFTSRAEYRLALREDNAHDRLAPMAHKYGLISQAEYDSIRAIQVATESLVSKMERTWVKTSELGELSQRFTKSKSVSVDKLLKLPGVDIGQVQKIALAADCTLSDHPEVFERAAIDVRYSGYIQKQQREIDKFKRMEGETIPEGFNYEPLKGLKIEAKEKFIRFRPGSLGQAGRIEGITPGDVAVLSVHLKRHKESANA